MKISLVSEPSADLTIIPTFSGKKSKAHERFSEEAFTGKEGEIRIRTGSPDVLFVGMSEDVSVFRYQKAIGDAVDRALKEQYLSIAIVADDCLRATTCATEAALLTARTFTQYMGKTKENVHEFTEIQIVSEDKDAYERACVVAHAANAMRDLQDTPSADMGPQDFADAATAMAKKQGLSIDVWDDKKIAAEGYNALLTVGKGSARKSRLVTLKHEHPDAKKTICLVGKGIIYDTGGYNIKPTGFMETMKFDMSGAALVYGVMQAVAELNLPVNVVGICPLADNRVSSTAYVPSDVIKTAHGVTVEVGNTDAEGRLVLSDALHHATTMQPDAIIDFATLTGACVVALGSTTAAILGTNEELAEELVLSGNVVGERIWPLPLFEEYEEDIKSKIADIKNIGYKREAGTITAAAFLRHFVDDIPWAHLDIAGVADVDRPRHFTRYGGTGWGVRTMIEWLSQQ